MNNELNTNMLWPKISIVTPTLNRAHMIEDAIKSVLNQHYPNFEHIIVDGKSTDNTLDVLSRYPHLHVISEPDHNVYDGLNKGIKLAQGNIIGHLNSDDLYDDNVFFTVAKAFLKNPEIDVVSGGAKIFKLLPNGKKFIIANYNKPVYKKLLPYNAILKSPITNARFFSRHLYNHIGNYNTYFSIAADRDFLIRVSIENINGISVPENFYIYRAHATSLTFHGNWKEIENSINQGLEIAETYLAKNNLSKKLRRYFRKKHFQHTVRKSLNALLNRHYKKALKYLWSGKHMQRYWILFFIPISCSIIFPSLKRRLVNSYKKQLCS